MDVPERREQRRAPDALAPIEGAAPIAIIDFLANAESVVHRLAQNTCVSDWVMTRRLGEEWVVLAGHGRHGFRPGDVLDRPEGAAAHLGALAAVWGQDVVVDLTEEHVEPQRRSTAPPGPAVHVDGLVAFPLWGGDGLFGAVCALPSTPEEEAQLRQTEAMVRLTVELLTSVLGLDLDRSRLQRSLDAAESAALSDPMTGLGNRRAFERAVDREEARCARFGHQAGIMVLDLDGLKAMNDKWGHSAGDELIRRAGETIRSSLRNADQAFRIGGDEFALILPEVSSDGLSRLHDRLADALAGAGIAASVGCAIRNPSGNLHASVRAADAEMYEAKRARSGGDQGRLRQ